MNLYFSNRNKCASRIISLREKFGRFWPFVKTGFGAWNCSLWRLGSGRNKLHPLETWVHLGATSLGVHLAALEWKTPLITSSNRS